MVRATNSQNKQDRSQRKLAVAGLDVEYVFRPDLSLIGARYNTKNTGEVATGGKAGPHYAIGKYSLSKRTTLHSTYAHARRWIIGPQ